MSCCVIDWTIKLCIYAVCYFESFFCLCSFKSELWNDLHYIVVKSKKKLWNVSIAFCISFLVLFRCKTEHNFFFFKFTSVLWRAKSLKKKKREPPITYICLDRSELWVVTVVTHIHVFYIVYVRSTKKSVG